jgi:hypothetical protein
MVLGCLGILVITTGFLLHKQKYKELFICIISPIITGLSFWLITGQQIGNVFEYFFSMIPIISGYGEAMAKSGSVIEEFFFFLLSTLLIVYIFTNKKVFLEKKYIYL